MQHAWWLAGTGLDGGSAFVLLPWPAAYLLPHCPQAPIRTLLGLKMRLSVAVLLVPLVVVFRAAAAATTIVVFTVVLGQTNFWYGVRSLGAIGRGSLMGASTGHRQGTGNDLCPSACSS